MPVGRVHIGLDLEDKGSEILIGRIHHTAVLQFPGLGRRGKFQEFLQEAPDPEVGHGGSEEHRCQFPCIHFLQIEFVPGQIQQLDIIHQSLEIGFSDGFPDGRIVQAAGGAL